MTQGKVKITHPVHGSRYVSQRSWQLMTESNPGEWSLAKADVLEAVRESIEAPKVEQLNKVDNAPKKRKKQKPI